MPTQVYRVYSILTRCLNFKPMKNHSQQTVLGVNIKIKVNWDSCGIYKLGWGLAFMKFIQSILARCLKFKIGNINNGN